VSSIHSSFREEGVQSKAIMISRPGIRPWGPIGD